MAEHLTRKTDEILARLIKGQAFSASIGEVTVPATWATIAPYLKNANSLLVGFGGSDNQIEVTESGLLYTFSTSGTQKLLVSPAKTISSVLSPPPGARTDGTNYFFL